MVALGKGIYLKDNATDCVIVSGLAKSCLSNQAKSYDFSLRLAEKAKFTKDRKFSYLVVSSATMRLIPKATYHLGLRGLRFKAILKEFAISVVTNPAGCSLFHGSFAVTHSGAVQHIVWTYGSVLTWTLYRGHAGQIVRGMQSFFWVLGFLVGVGTNDC